MDTNRFFDKILQQINRIADATGLLRCLLLTELAQMVSTLQEGWNKEQEKHKTEIGKLQKQIDDLVASIGPKEEEKREQEE